MNPEFEMKKKLDAEKDAFGQRFVQAFMDLISGDSLKYIHNLNVNSVKEESALRFEYKNIIKGYHLDENYDAHLDTSGLSLGDERRHKEFLQKDNLIEQKYANLFKEHYEKIMSVHGVDVYNTYVSYNKIENEDDSQEEALRHNFLVDHCGEMHTSTIEQLMESLGCELGKQEKELIAGEKYGKLNLAPS